MEQATDLARQLNISYLETSALTASNVEQVFIMLTTGIYRKKVPKPIDSSSSGKPSLSIDQDLGRTVPVTSEAHIEIGPKPSSFRLKDNQSSATNKRNNCCSK